MSSQIVRKSADAFKNASLVIEETVCPSLLITLLTSSHQISGEKQTRFPLEKSFQQRPLPFLAYSLVLTKPTPRQRTVVNGHLTSTPLVAPRMGP